MTRQDPRHRPDAPPAPPARTAERCVSARALMGAGSTLLIEHAGSLYRLRITRAGKLILTK